MSCGRVVLDKAMDTQGKQEGNTGNMKHSHCRKRNCGGFTENEPEMSRVMGYCGAFFGRLSTADLSKDGCTDTCVSHNNN